MLRLVGAKVATNASWLILEKLILLLAGFLLTVVLSRYWSVAELGDFQFMLALIAILAPFTNLGLNSIVSRELVLEPHRINEIMGTSIGLRLCGALTGIALFSIMSIFLVSVELLPFFLILLLCQLFQSFNVVSYYFEALVQSKISAILRTTVGLTFIAIKLALVIGGVGVKFIIIIAALEALLLGCLWLFVYGRHSKKLSQIRWSNIQAIGFIKRSGWLFFSSIAAVIYLKVDQVMLGTLTNSETVGFYSIASKLSEMWYILPTIVVASLFPSLIKLKSRDESAYQNSIQRLCNTLCWVAIAIALIMTLFAEVLIVTLFGTKYAMSADILQIQVWAAVFIYMRALFSKWILVEDLPKYSLYTQLGGALMNVLLNLLLIPSLGAKGAAWATLVSYSFASFFVLFIFKETRGMAIIMSKALFLPGMMAFSTRK